MLHILYVVYFIVVYEVMKNLWKKNWKRLLPVLVIFVWYGAYTHLQKTQDTPWWLSVGGAPITNTFSSVTMKVAKKSFDSSIQKEWTIKVENEQKMKFASDARVTSVVVKKWQKVSKWDILASIDATWVNNAVKKAQRSLRDAQEKMKEFVDVFEEDVVEKAKKEERNAQRQIDQKMREKEQMKSKQEQDRISQVQSLREAEKNMRDVEQRAKKHIWQSDLLQNIIKQKIDQYHKTIEGHHDRLQENHDTYETIIKDVDKIINICYSEHHFPYESQLWAQGDNIKGMAKDALLVVCGSRNVFEKKIKQTTKRDSEKILELTRSQTDIHKNILHTLDAAISALDQSVLSTDLTKERIEEYKKPLTDHKKTIEKIDQSIASHIISIIEYHKTKNTAEQNIKQDVTIEADGVDLKIRHAKLALQNERTNGENLLRKQKEEREQIDEDIATLRKDLRRLQKKNKKIITLTTNPDYKDLKDAVEQAQWSLDEENKKYETYVLKAPFDGEVADLKMRTGDIGNTDNIYIAITDPNAIQVTISLSQSEVGKVKAWMQATVRVDAYDGEVFSGYVSSVDTTPNTDSGGIEFMAHIKLKNHTNKKLYSGMKAKVSLLLKQLNASLVVPFTAVASDETGKKYVMRMSGWKKEKVYVEVGYTDGKHYQVTKGLKEWDTILEIDYNATQYAPEKKSWEGEYSSEWGMGMEAGMMY